MRSNQINNHAKEAEGLAPFGGELNAEGYPALPTELHLEIISYFPLTPVPTHKQPQEIDCDLEALRTRRFTLFSLSHTCRALRHVFLQYAWQRIEVFGGMQTSKGRLPTLASLYYGEGVRPKSYAQELIRQLKIVTFCNPGLAKYVQ